jgi:hypothetical protein
MAGVLVGTEGAGVAWVLVFAPFLLSSSSQHPPNQQAVWQMVVVVVIVVAVTPEVVDDGSGRVLVIVVEMVVVTGESSRQPNHPMLIQVVVVYREVIVVRGVDADVVVIGSSHPHQPGCLQVSVRVRVIVDEEVLLCEEVLDVVVDSVPLLSKNVQLKQSEQSTSVSHFGTVSYLSRTS